jgi:hypothetical protein
LKCPFGNQINKVLTPRFDRARKSMEESLAGVTIEELLSEFPRSVFQKVLSLNNNRS